MKNTILRDKMLNHPIVKNLVNITNVTQLLNHVKNNYGKEVAVIKTDGKAKTFEDLYNDVLIVANNLKQYSGNIGLFSRNGYEFEVVALAAMASIQPSFRLP